MAKSLKDKPVKRYKYKAKDYRKKVKKYWSMLDDIECEFHAKITQLEDRMRSEVGIDDLEFFWCDNDIVGIGNVTRTLELIGRSYDA